MSEEYTSIEKRNIIAKFQELSDKNLDGYWANEKLKPDFRVNSVGILEIFTISNIYKSELITKVNLEKLYSEDTELIDLIHSVVSHESFNSRNKKYDNQCRTIIANRKNVSKPIVIEDGLKASAV
jgi:hypothetical protein